MLCNLVRLRRYSQPLQRRWDLLFPEQPAWCWSAGSSRGQPDRLQVSPIPGAGCPGVSYAFAPAPGPFWRNYGGASNGLVSLLCWSVGTKPRSLLAEDDGDDGEEKEDEEKDDPQVGDIHGRALQDPRYKCQAGLGVEGLEEAQHQHQRIDRGHASIAAIFSEGPW